MQGSAMVGVASTGTPRCFKLLQQLYGTRQMNDTLMHQMQDPSGSVGTPRADPWGVTLEDCTSGVF